MATLETTPALPDTAPAPAPRASFPASWAKAKGTPAWVLAGAYSSSRWERDGAGNDLSLVTEVDFDAACAAVANISINSAPHPRKG